MYHYKHLYVYFYILKSGLKTDFWQEVIVELSPDMEGIKWMTWRKLSAIQFLMYAK